MVYFLVDELGGCGDPCPPNDVGGSALNSLRVQVRRRRRRSFRINMRIKL